jgi:pyruvate/2-oxoglutarate dehydrogenase complex dihydrolipoamide acyltransferase (E2) component
MATPVLMPKFGQTMTEGTIVKWEKRVGDLVKKGEVLLKIETDKSEMDVEADEGGYLLKVTAAEGQLVPCGETIAWLGAKGEKL